MIIKQKTASLRTGIQKKANQLTKLKLKMVRCEQQLSEMPVN